jgi:NAD+ kinase
MIVGIYTNKFKDADFSLTNEFKNKLKKVNIENIDVDETSDLKDIELLVVLGGDGTILKLASFCGKNNIPVLGINIGNLGFLTEFEWEQSDEAVKFIKERNWKLDSRSLLKAEVDGNIYFGLNDIVVQRMFVSDCESQVINLTAKIDGSLVDNFICDGLIISTPTGSTAYSLSCGGGILTPDINAFCLTPICAHSLHNRPIVFSEKSSIVIENKDKNSCMALINDGKMSIKLSGSQKVFISKAEFNVNFLRRDDSNFFNKLLIKLNKWSINEKGD